jgi:hypothetical protein
MHGPHYDAHQHTHAAQRQLPRGGGSSGDEGPGSRAGAWERRLEPELLGGPAPPAITRPANYQASKLRLQSPPVPAWV